MKNWNDYVHAASDLDELLERLNEFHEYIDSPQFNVFDDIVNFSSLPTFSDNAPEDTMDMFSWDDTHFLAYYGNGDWRVVPRDDEDVA